MRQNSLMKKEDTVIRVLEKKMDKLFVIDCIRRSMLSWVELPELDGYEACSEDELCKRTGMVLFDLDSADTEVRKFVREHFTLIAPVLPFVSDKKQRSAVITRITTVYGVSKQTIRNYLCLYLVYQDISALAPKPKVPEAELTEDEKIMRWSLNKYFYNQNKNSISAAYR